MLHGHWRGHWKPRRLVGSRQSRVWRCSWRRWYRWRNGRGRISRAVVVVIVVVVVGGRWYQCRWHRHRELWRHHGVAVESRIHKRQTRSRWQWWGRREHFGGIVLVARRRRRSGIWCRHGRCRCRRCGFCCRCDYRGQLIGLKICRGGDHHCHFHVHGGWWWWWWRWWLVIGKRRCGGRCGHCRCRCKWWHSWLWRQLHVALWLVVAERKARTTSRRRREGRRQWSASGRDTTIFRGCVFRMIQRSHLRLNVVASVDGQHGTSLLLLLLLHKLLLLFLVSRSRRRALENPGRKEQLRSRFNNRWWCWCWWWRRICCCKCCWRPAAAAAAVNVAQTVFVLLFVDGKVDLAHMVLRILGRRKGPLT